MTPAEPQLIVSGLTKAFKGPAGTLEVLRGVDLQLKRGDSMAVTGPSGSGKSTLLYILGTLDQPTSGEVQLDGRNLFLLNEKQQAEYRNKNVGFVFQDHHLLPQCTVLENVLIPTLAGAGVRAEEVSRAEALLERVGLAERLGHRPAQLSGGERQRVAVCRALVNQPALLLADEPTGNLDRASAQAVGTLLLEIGREQNTMLLCVTHSTELADRFPRHDELRDGKLVTAASQP